MHSGRPQKQALAIAYAEQRRGKRKHRMPRPNKAGYY